MPVPRACHGYKITMMAGRLFIASVHGRREKGKPDGNRWSRDYTTYTIFIFIYNIILIINYIRDTRTRSVHMER